jgi:hypothetical protein
MSIGFAIFQKHDLRGAITESTELARWCMKLSVSSPCLVVASVVNVIIESLPSSHKTSPAMIQSLLNYFHVTPDEAMTMGSAVLRDYSGSAGLYFVRIRTPASMLAGSSLAAFFACSKFDSDNQTKCERLVAKSYMAFALFTFALSFAAIVVSTGGSISVIHGDFNPKAETAYALLMREFEYEFTLTRWTYSMSLLSFLIAVTHRAVLEFNLTETRCKNKRMALLCFMLALISYLISYMNQHLYSWKNLLHMTLYMLQMTARQCLEDRDPFVTMAILASTMAGYYGIKAVIDEQNNKLKED